jgi:hypothetical protein
VTALGSLMLMLLCKRHQSLTENLHIVLIYMQGEISRVFGKVLCVAQQRQQVI